VIPFDVPVYSIQEQIALPLRIPKCDLFWSPHFNIPLAPIRARQRLVTIHDVYFLSHPQELSWPKKKYAHLFYHAAATKSDQIITVSEFSKKEILRHIPIDTDKITPIPLGVDPKKFQKQEPLSIKLPSRYILYVGNLAPHKNLCRLLQSLDFLPADIHLVLAGKSVRWKEWEKEMIKRESRVTVLGQVSQATLAHLYQHATLLIHPSLYEGFGLTPLEAMSAGCPVVSSNAASLPEVCLDAALYVDPLSSEDIARGILSVWTDSSLQEDLRQKGMSRTQAVSWEVSARKHLEIIEKLFSNPEGSYFRSMSASDTSSLLSVSS